MPPTLKYQISYRIAWDRRGCGREQEGNGNQVLKWISTSYSSQKVKIGRLGGIKAASVLKGRLDLEIAARKTRI